MRSLGTDATTTKLLLPLILISDSLLSFSRSTTSRIKSDSSDWINRKKLARGKFAWQEGYGAFSYGHSRLDMIIRYIQNQERHHKRRSFREEYLTLLKKFEIEFKEEYVFK